MKLIQRYGRIWRSQTIAAGVYSASAATTINMGPFTTIINSFTIGFKSQDTVTNQFIAGGCNVKVGIDTKRDNPGINSTYLNDELSVGHGGYGKFDMMLNINASESFVLTFLYYLESVTANAIAGQITVLIGYLCPEDYLSVDGFAANPM